MKRLFYLFIPCAFLFSCTAPEKEEKGKIMEYIGDEESDEVMNENADIEIVNEPVDGIETEHILFCRIGDYYEPAIMVLDWEEQDDDNRTYPITGYYYYLKHGKNLVLDGYSEPSTKGIYLNESYKGKASGYMEFAQDDWYGENFWATSKSSEDQQYFYSEDIQFNDPGIEVNLVYEAYSFDHSVTMFDGEEDYDMDATNELFITRINDEFLAFSLQVICTNGHQGNIDGVAEIKGDKAFFNQEENDDDSACSLEFDLGTPGEISVIEIDCSDYHGARAYFDGTLYKKK